MFQLHLPVHHNPDAGHDAVLHGSRGQDHGPVLTLRHRGGHLHGLVHHGVHHPPLLLPRQNELLQESHELD